MQEHKWIYLTGAHTHRVHADEVPHAHQWRAHLVELEPVIHLLVSVKGV